MHLINLVIKLGYHINAVCHYKVCFLHETSFSVLFVDFDEQTADDWDVDMSVYYDKGILTVFYSFNRLD